MWKEGVTTSIRPSFQSSLYLFLLFKIHESQDMRGDVTDKISFFYAYVGVKELAAEARECGPHRQENIYQIQCLQTKF